MARTIISAHDPRVVVEVLIPPAPPKKKNLVFRAPRFEFMPREKAEEFDEWLAAILADVDDEVNPKVILTEELMLNFWIQRLDLKDADALLDLTRGEKQQIWEAWRDESNKPLGESEPSSIS